MRNLCLCLLLLLNGYLAIGNAQIILSPTASWAGNATTVAGSATAQSGATSSLLNTVYGIHITDDNTLYVADWANHRIAVVRPNSTTAIQIFGSGPGSAQTQLNQPTDVFATSTTVFILDSANYRVQRYSRDGTQVATAAGNTGFSGGSTSLTGFQISYALFVDDFGFLYVSDCGNHRVMRFPPNSSNGTSAVIVAGTGSSGSSPALLNSPRGIFVASDDLTLYIADTSNHRIQRWVNNACSGVTVAGTGSPGSGLDQLNTPVAVVVDTNNYMYITDQGNTRILRWLVGACTGECIASCSNSGAGSTADKLSNPRGIGFDSQGSLYVCDSSNNRVQKFLILASAVGGSGTSMSTASTWTAPVTGTTRTSMSASVTVPSTARWAGNATTVAGSATAQPGATSSLLNTVYGIHITDDNTLYVADWANHRIVAVRPNSTTAIQIFGSGPGSAQTQLNQPTDIFATSTTVFILDSVNYRVQRYSRDDTQVATAAGNTGSWGGSTSLTGFGISYALFVDAFGFLYVSDCGNHRVMRFPPNSSNGTSAVIVAGAGSPGSSPALLNSPRGIFVDGSLTLYVADTSNNRIQRWVNNACSGVTVAGTGSPGSGLDQLNTPVAVVVDTNNYMYITDQLNNRILRWLVGACVGECIAACSNSFGSTADKFWFARGIGFDTQGSLYVGDGSNNRVQKFSVLTTTGSNNGTSMSVAGSWTVGGVTSRTLPSTATLLATVTTGIMARAVSTTTAGIGSASSPTATSSPSLSANIQMGCFLQANLWFNASGSTIQQAQLNNITCNQCFCRLIQSNVWTIMACQTSQATCQLLSLDLQSLSQYVRIDTSSIVCFPSYNASGSNSSRMASGRNKRHIEADAPEQDSAILWNFDGDLKDFDGTHPAIANAPPPIYQSPGYNGNGSCLLLQSLAPSVSLDPPFLSDLVQHSFTIECWLLAQSMPNQLIPILAMLERETSQPLLTLTIQERRVQFTLASTHIVSHQLLITKQWYHLALIYDEDSSTQMLFIDGLLDAHQTSVGPLQRQVDRVVIGAMDGNPSTNLSDVCVDALLFLSRAKNVSEVLDDTTLLLSLTFDQSNLHDTGPLHITDVTGTNYAFTTLAQVNIALNLSHPSSFVQISDLRHLGVPGRSYTLSLWIYPIERLAGTILQLSDPASTRLCLTMLGLTSSGHIIMQSSSESSLPLLGPMLDLVTWTHVAVTYSSSHGQRLYINGVRYGQSLDASGSVPTTITLGSKVDGDGGRCTNERCQYSGLMDEFRVYARELSPSELHAAVNS